MARDVNSKPLRAVVAAVQLPGVSDVELDASLTELRQLAKTLGFEVVHRFTQKRAGFDSAGYFGTGKRAELKAIVEDGADIVLVDHEISPSQAHTLEQEVGCEVMDRTMVILEIFHRHARSRAARAQVEIARLGYMAPRMREAAKLAGPKDRARSGTGGRSGGESHGELDRRKIRDRIAELQKELDGMKRVVVYGATPLGVEMAGNLGHRGLHVDFVDEGPWVLSEVLDPDVAEPVHESLEKRGVTMRLGTKVEGFEGANGRVGFSRTSFGEGKDEKARRRRSGSRARARRR